MQLTSTISLVAPGNTGGALSLFFTTMNPADYKPIGDTIAWQGSGKGAQVTYTLATGDVISLNLALVSTYPTSLYIEGAIQVTTSGGVVYGAHIGQAPPTGFAPGSPVSTMMSGQATGTSGGLQFVVGFSLPVPWDGTSADCNGSWWARWQ